MCVNSWRFIYTYMLRCNTKLKISQKSREILSAFLNHFRAKAFTCIVVAIEFYFKVGVIPWQSFIYDSHSTINSEFLVILKHWLHAELQLLKTCFFNNTCITLAACLNILLHNSSSSVAKWLNVCLWLNIDPCNHRIFKIF